MLRLVSRYFCPILSGLALLLSTTALVGWVVNRPLLIKDFLPFHGMVFSVAVSLILLSVCVLLLYYSSHRYIVRFVSGTILLFSFYVFLENTLFLNLNLEELFYKNTAVTGALIPGRMSANTLTCFGLLSLSLIFSTVRETRAKFWTSSCLTVLAISLAFLSIMNFILGHTGQSGWYNMNALPTNISILSIALSLYFLLIYKDGNYQGWYSFHFGIASFVVAFGLWGVVTSKEFGPITEAKYLVNYIYGTLIALSIAGGIIFTRKVILVIDDLIETRFLIEANSQTKERLLRYISHEIRNPLTSIIGYAEPLSKMQVSDDIKDASEGILTSSRHLKNVVDDLLAASRYESGRLELQKEEAQFIPWIEELGKLLESQCSRKEIHFEMKISEKRPALVILDLSKVSQIILNLVGNAIKHTPANGNITLTIEFDIDQNSGRNMKVSVSDTGEGIPLEDQNKLFRPFSQATTKDKTVGMGLGLAVCKTFVEMMGGQIGFSSESAKGSTFYFTINW